MQKRQSPMVNGGQTFNYQQNLFSDSLNSLINYQCKMLQPATRVPAHIKTVGKLNMLKTDEKPESLLLSYTIGLYQGSYSECMSLITLSFNWCLYLRK